MEIKIFVFNPVQENTYVLYDATGEAVVIDCGASTEQECKALSDFIREHELKLKYLLNTHLHFDHMLGNQYMLDTYNLKPMYHETEELLPGVNKQTAGFGLPLNCKPVHADTFLNEGDEVNFGNTTLGTILVPGHSPGSLCFYNKEEGCLFAGDVLFRHSIGRTDLWGGNHNQLITGICQKLLTLPEDTIVYPGHGPATTIKDEKQFNPYL